MTNIVLKYGDNNEDVKMLQRALNVMMKTKLVADGGFGKLTEEALRSYQKAQGLTVDGIYQGAVAEQLDHYISQKFLRTADIAVAAQSINVPASMLMAFREVEARGEGFLNDGRPVILFERHKFYNQIKLKSGPTHAETLFKTIPDVCNPEKGGYLGYEREYDRLNKAASFNKEAALNSASWGLFQIMGFNSKICGYPNVNDFVDANYRSEQDQLRCVLGFITSQNELVTAIRQRNYLRVAQIYNGPAQVGYDQKLRVADTNYKKLGY